MVNNLRRLCQKPARPDAYPPLRWSRGATVCDTLSLPARLSGDTLSYCVANLSSIRNQRVTLGTTADDCGVVTWISTVVCPSCIVEHDRLRKVLPSSKGLVGCHAPVLVRRLADSDVYWLADKLKRLGGGGGKGGS